MPAYDKVNNNARPCRTSKTSENKPSYTYDGTVNDISPSRRRSDGFWPVSETCPIGKSWTQDFKLSEAQELVARKHGFESWPALIKGIETMTESTASSAGAPLIIAAEPQLFVSDIKLSCRFFVNELGFKVGFSYGKPPFCAQVIRDGGRLNLRKVSGPVFDSSFRARERDALSATLTLDDIKPLFLEFQNAGVSFHQPLKTEPWGVRTFIVKDPDGNLICFAGGAL